MSPLQSHLFPGWERPGSSFFFTQRKCSSSSPPSPPTPSWWLSAKFAPHHWCLSCFGRPQNKQSILDVISWLLCKGELLTTCAVPELLQMQPDTLLAFITASVHSSCWLNLLSLMTCVSFSKEYPRSQSDAGGWSVPGAGLLPLNFINFIFFQLLPVVYSAKPPSHSLCSVSNKLTKGLIRQRATF